MEKRLISIPTAKPYPSPDSGVIGGSLAEQVITFLALLLMMVKWAKTKFKKLPGLSAVNSNAADRPAPKLAPVAVALPQDAEEAVEAPQPAPVVEVRNHPLPLAPVDWTDEALVLPEPTAKNYVPGLFLPKHGTGAKPHVAIEGPTNIGKTTLIQKEVAYATGLGYRFIILDAKVQGGDWPGVTEVFGRGFNYAEIGQVMKLIEEVIIARRQEAYGMGRKEFPPVILFVDDGNNVIDILASQGIDFSTWFFLKLAPICRAIGIFLWFSCQSFQVEALKLKSGGSLRDNFAKLVLELDGQGQRQLSLHKLYGGIYKPTPQTWAVPQIVSAPPTPQVQVALGDETLRLDSHTTATLVATTKAAPQAPVQPVEVPTTMPSKALESPIPVVAVAPPAKEKHVEIIAAYEEMAGQSPNGQVSITAVTRKVFGVNGGTPFYECRDAIHAHLAAKEAASQAQVGTEGVDLG